ncbi:MAG: translocation/assembly module TamB domain-containing protein [Chitinophagales bacterium]
MKRFKKIALILLLLIAVVINLMYFVANSSTVQTFIAQKATQILSASLGAEISIEKAELRFFTKVVLHNVLILDQESDTLLYAGQINTRINFINPFKNRYYLSELRIDQLYINFNKKAGAEQYNYEFLGITNNSSKKAKSEIPDFKLKQLYINNLKFSQYNAAKRQKLFLNSNLASVSSKNIDLPNKQVHINALILEKAYVEYQKFGLVDSAQKDLSTVASTSWNPDNWDIRIDHTMLSNSEFHYQKTGYPYEGEGIDYNNISVSRINLDIKNTYFDCDSIKTEIDNLNAREKSGFQINNLQAIAKIAPDEMVFEQLQLRTPNSHINDYYAMRYDNINDFNDYVNKVRMEGRFQNAKIALQDINYFAKVLNKIEHNTVSLTGSVSGPVSKLRGKNLKIDFARSSRFEGEIAMTGLPDFKETFIRLDINRSSGNFKEVFDFYPHINPVLKNMENLGKVNFYGKFIGFPNDFVAEGTLVSEIGKIESDINVKLQEQDVNSSYSGKLSATDFDLGKWLGQEDQLGKLSFTTQVEGTGLELDNMDARLNGDIEKLGLLGYEYSEINVDGSLQRRLFEGKLIADDPNFNLEFDGLVDFMDSVPKLSFKALVHKADLQALNITDSVFTFNSNMRLDLVGDDIDNFSGTGSLYNNKIITSNDSFLLDTLIVNARQIDEQSRYIGINSDLADATFNGYFSFRTLPKALSDFARFYIVQYSKSEEAESFIKQSEQLFTFDIDIKDSKNFTKLLWPGLESIQSGEMKGSFSSFNNTLIMNSEIRHIHLLQSEIRNFKLRTTSSGNKFQIRSTIDSVFYKDSLVSEWIEFNSDMKEDSIHFYAGIQKTGDPNYMKLNGYFQSDLKSLRGGFKNSEIVLLNESWVFSEPNLIALNKNFLNIENLKLSNKDHVLKINTQTTKDSLVNLNVELEQFPLSEVSDILRNFTHFSINGMAVGNFKVEDLFGKQQLRSSLDVKNLEINDYPMGELTSRIVYGHNSDLMNIEGTLLGQGNDVLLSGHYDLGNVTDKLNLIFRVRKFNLVNTAPFFQDVVTRPTGNMSGNIFIYGSPQKPILSGKLKAENLSAKVNYLNTRYSIPTLTAELKDDRINFSDFQVFDNENNLALGEGKIRHDYLKNFFLDFNINTEALKFLDTKSSHNQSFYGTAYGKGYVMIAGDLNNIDFYINATTLKNSELAVSVSESKEVEQYNFYRFVKSDNEKADEKKKDFIVKRSPISVNMDLRFTEATQLSLILDYEEGDVIRGNGNGKLKISLDNFNELNISGKYIIEEGDYLFSLQNLISKKFKMESGSSITWLGDPTDARLDINAVYKLRTSPYDLIEDAVVANADLESAARSRVPTYLYLLIGGTLDNPRINFDIKVPDADQAIKSTLDNKLQLVKLDPNELNKQVVALLVLNRFVPVHPLGSNTNNTVLEGVNNTVSEFLSNQLSLYLSDWISQFITEVQLDVNFRNYQTELGNNGGGGDISNEEDFQNRRELQLALTKSFLNNRLIIDIGGNFDFGQENQTVNSQNNDATNVTGDFEIQYGLTKDNRLRMKAFRKSEYDIFNERNRNKTGLGVLYQREFDNVIDLLRFIRRKKEKKAESEQNKSETNTESID